MRFDFAKASTTGQTKHPPLTSSPLWALSVHPSGSYGPSAEAMSEASYTVAKKHLLIK